MTDIGKRRRILEVPAPVEAPTQAPAALLDDPRIAWGNVDPAGPPPPTLAAEVAKLAKAVGSQWTVYRCRHCKRWHRSTKPER